MSELSLSDEVGLGRGGSSRRSARANARRRRRRRRRSFFSLLIALAVVSGLVYGAYVGIKPLTKGLFQPTDWPGPGDGSVTVRIEPGASVRRIAHVLVADQVVKTEGAFVDAASKHANDLQPGSYHLRRHMSGAQAVALLLNPSSRIVTRVTIPEGTRAADVVRLLATKGGLPKADLQAALKNPAQLGLPASAKGVVEGYLYPATYEIDPSTTAAGLLADMIARTESVLRDQGVAPAQEHDVLTKASILEAEAGSSANFGKVATVIDNRLKIGKRLELDSTVAYANNRFGITTTAKERALKSPYNTYQNTGLPAGPIDCPGEQAIVAVLHPTPGTWLYFVTVNPQTGLTKFATTLAEKAAIDKEFQAWLRTHPHS